MAAAADLARGALRLLLWLLLVLALAPSPALARPDKETREKFYGDLVRSEVRNNSGDGSIADMFDRVLEKEFSENDTPEGEQSRFFFSFPSWFLTWVIDLGD